MKLDLTITLDCGGTITFRGEDLTAESMSAVLGIVASAGAPEPPAPAPAASKPLICGHFYKELPEPLACRLRFEHAGDHVYTRPNDHLCGYVSRGLAEGTTARWVCQLPHGHAGPFHRNLDGELFEV